MSVDTDGGGGLTALNKRRSAPIRRLPVQVARRLGWGVADQAVSSLTNFALSIYMVRTLGAAEFGAFGLAYVTYSFVLNASRGLTSDPLMVRFSAVDLRVWRRAVAECTGTAAVVGLVSGGCVLIAAALLDNAAAKFAFLALGLTLPALMLQDSWRFSFFARGRGGLALLNDLVWAVVLIPSLVLLRITGHADVFWCVFAWGASAAVAAAVGPLQARTRPRLSSARVWLSRNRDLGPRYLAENTTMSGAYQLRTYVVGLIVGLAAVGYVQAANTLVGPIMVVFMGMGLVTIPEGARILRRSPERLQLFCLLVSAGLATVTLGWGVVLIVALPRGLGSGLLGPIWHQAYPLVPPLIISMMGTCASSGAGTGLHALGAARRSLRAMAISSVIYLVSGLIGVVTGGVVGTVRAAAVATWISALVWWWQLRAGLRDAGHASGRHRSRFGLTARLRGRKRPSARKAEKHQPDDYQAPA